MGLMYNCAYLSVGYYFDKNRALATAIASSGTGESESTASATVLEYSQYAQCVNFKYAGSSF